MQMYELVHHRYESIIATLCENLDTLDEPEAKASMIWIIGEYAERIDNADELLEQFLETFPEETSQVCCWVQAHHLILCVERALRAKLSGDGLPPCMEAS